MAKNITIGFICNVYQHIINADGDWSGYKTQWTIQAQTLEEAKELLFSKCNMHTEVTNFVKFVNPIDNKTYSIEEYDYMREALESLKKATMATRMTFLDREMPHLAY